MLFIPPGPVPMRARTPDRCFFDTMRQRLAHQGGMRCEAALADGQAPTLARLLDRQAIRCIPWRSQRWIPLFQLHRHGLCPRGDVALIAAELTGAMDDLEILAWFACPNSALAGQTPIGSLDRGFDAVRAAARVDRFLMSA